MRWEAQQVPQVSKEVEEVEELQVLKEGLPPHSRQCF
jgi:hypothetical protein